MSKNDKQFFFRLFSSAVMVLALCSAWGCSSFLESRPVVTTLTESTAAPSYNGVFNGNLTMKKSLITGDFATGNVITTQVTRSSFRVEDYYTVYQSLPSDPQDPDYIECVYESWYVRSDYNSQLGCDVVYDDSTLQGSVQIVLTGLSNLNLGTGEMDDYSRGFAWSGKNYTLMFGKDVPDTGIARYNTFSVLLIEHSILFPDGLGEIAF